MYEKSTRELFRLHVVIHNELRRRNVVRTANTPTGDYAERIFCDALKWVQAPNSQPSIDAVGLDGTRYQIKARRLHSRNKSRQLSSLRNLKDSRFDILAGLLFDEYYGIHRAALIPHHIVLQRARFSTHTNSHLFLLHDDVWKEPGVRDVTTELQEFAVSMM